MLGGQPPGLSFSRHQNYFQVREADGEQIRWRKFILLLLVVPLFGGSFHYLKSAHALWALSKALPFLSLPLALLLFRGERPVVTRQMLVTLLYLFLVPSFAGIFTYQQNFFTGLTSQVKLLPMFYFFSFLALLNWLQPNPKEIKNTYLIYGALTFLLLYLFWVFVPQSWYMGSYKLGEDQFFTVDSRGNRIRMPLYFGMVAMFYCYRRFFQSKSPWWLLLTAIGFTAVLQIERTRSTVLVVAAVLAINALRFSRPVVRMVLLALIPIGGVLLFSVPYVASITNTDASSGFDIRKFTIQKSLDALGMNPVSWLFGLGSISPLEPNGMIVYFSHWFFLADITWLGIVFEFGLIGALLILAIPVRGIMLSRDLPGSKENTFLGSLQDYLIFVILMSPFYPLTLLPGEYAIILAIFIYEKKRQQDAELRGVYA